MALELTTKAFLASRETKLEPLVILEIDGVDSIFGTTPVTSVIKYGEGYKYGDDIVYGGLVVNENSRDYISLEGTTNNITQQLLQDKGATSSVSNFNINIIDKNREVSEAFIPTINEGDLLSRDAKIYLGLQGTSHPEDSVEIFQGIVASAQYKQGSILIRVSHPEELKRQEFFEQRVTELDGAIDDTVTTIPVNNAAGFLESADSVTTHFRVDDEVIEIGTVNLGSNQFESCVRGALGTTAASHDDDQECTSLYVHTDNALEAALKLMLSGGDQFYATLDATGFVNVNNAAINNAISFNVGDLDSTLGVAVGDFVQSTGAANSENNFTSRSITSVVSLGTSSYITVDGAPLVEEVGGATISFQSQWNVLPDGLAMKPRQVDVERHRELNSTFSGSFPTYTFYYKDTLKGKQHIDQEIYFPAACFSLNRKGRASVGFTAPPLSLETVPTINLDNVVNMDKLSLERSINDKFYNVVVFKYNEQLLEEEFLAVNIISSEDSFNRIKGIKRNKPLNIESKGLRRDPTSLNIINRSSQRFTDRYKFAAAMIKKVQVFYKDGFVLEAGDIVRVDLPIVDPETGTLLEPKLYEISNKKLNFKTGKINVDLIDTAYELNSRFGVISPASDLDDASSSTRLRLTSSYGNEGEEITKWVQLVGATIEVFNEDFTQVGTTVIQEVDPILPETLVVSPALGFTPDSTHSIELADYDDSDIDAQSTAKNTYCYWTPFASVTSGASNTVFDIDSTVDATLGAIVRVHSEDFTRESEDTTITDITSNTITVADDLGFTPLSGDLLEIIEFLDGGAGYRFV